MQKHPLIMGTCFHDLEFCILLRIVGVSHFTGKYAQVTNNPENDGCINAVLLV